MQYFETVFKPFKAIQNTPNDTIWSIWAMGVVIIRDNTMQSD